MIPPLERRFYRLSTPTTLGTLVSDELAVTEQQARSLHMAWIYRTHTTAIETTGGTVLMQVRDTLPMPDPPEGSPV